MILVGADFDKTDFVAFLDFKADILQCSLDRFGKGLFPIFHGTDQVIEEKRLVVTLGDVFAHPKRLHLREPTPHATCEVLRNKTEKPKMTVFEGIGNYFSMTAGTEQNEWKRLHSLGVYLRKHGAQQGNC